MVAATSASTSHQVQQFVHDVNKASTFAEISGLLSDVTRALDFDHFAMTQRQSMRREGAPVQLNNFPMTWIERLANDDNLADDPVLLASQKTATPFSWDDLPALIRLTPEQKSYLQIAANAGLVRGWTVPIHIPGEASGLCSFVVANDRALPCANLPSAHYVASFGFAAARRLAAGQRPPPPRLTRRQLDCVVLAARGKSDWVAGQLLGLAPDTVHKYLEQAKARFGVSSRTELVVRALHDGQISFADLLH